MAGAAAGVWMAAMLAAPAMTVYVQVGSTNITSDVEATDTIESWKSKIAAGSGVLPELQLLRFAGKDLEDGRTLADYNIQNNATAYVLPDLRTNTTSGSQTWTGGSVVWIPFYNAAGTAGTDWRLLNTTGPLTIDATPGNPIILRPITYSSSSAYFEGAMINFDPAADYAWTIATAGSIAGYSAKVFTVDTSYFENGIGGGTFSVGQGSLVLNYDGVPEPSSALLILFGAAALFTRRAFRRAR